jgi:hypothetical protein
MVKEGQHRMKDGRRRRLTEEEFVEEKGEACPFCGSHWTREGEPKRGEHEVTISTRCLNCRSMWEAVYVLGRYAYVFDGR